MSDPKRLALDLLEHLRSFDDLGAKWTVRAAAPSRAKRFATAQGSPALAKPAPGQPPGPPIAVRSESMFDVLPVDREELDAIRSDLGDCRRCKLAPSRKTIVFGSGDPGARLMFVGEAPGADEDEQGLPFVGRAGQLLTRIIEAIDLRREDVYICNILKCRPPGNRNPEPDEIAACQPFLFRQIESVRPAVICALGTFGAQTLLGTREPISRLRGRLIDFRGAKLMATFHPAYLLRNPAEKRKVWEDVQAIRDYLRSLPA
jgi:DNA polymerase